MCEKKKNRSDVLKKKQESKCQQREIKSFLRIEIWKKIFIQFTICFGENDKREHVLCAMSVTLEVTHLDKSLLNTEAERNAANTK